MNSFWSAMGSHTFAGSEASPSLTAVRHDGKDITNEQRKELLERSRAGEHLEIEFDAVTYIQRDTPNKNFLRFRDGGLRKMASSGKGSVFLMDHNQGSLMARGGTVKSSKLIKDEDGNPAFLQTILMTKDWAVQGVLDGTIDRFSIGWSPTGPVTYRHNGKELEAWPKHWPGDKLEDGTVVEWVFSNAELIETSGVNVPAVAGTQIEGIREALSLALGKASNSKQSAKTDSGMVSHGEKQMDGIKSVLGLSSSASEQDIAAAVGQLKASLSVAEAKHKESAEAYAALSAQVELDRAKYLEETIESEITAALADGRLKLTRDSSGARVPSQVETAIRKMGSTLGLDAFKEQLSALPKMHGAPAFSQSVGTDPDPTPVNRDKAQEVLAHNPHMATCMNQLGLTEDDLRKYGRLEEIPGTILRN